MSELEGVYVIWKREVRRYMRERALVFSTIFMSILWLVIFGIGIGSMRFGRMAGDYQAFLFPGIIGMALLVTSIRSGISIIRDRELGFLRVVVLAPVSRSAVVLGKALGGCTVAVFQGVVILFLSSIVDVPITSTIAIRSIIIMTLMALGLVCMGLVIASLLRSFEGFNLIMTLLIMPMFFLSGALFPIHIMPDWMATLTLINPLTYGVDGLRSVIIGMTAFSLKIDLLVMAGYALLMLGLAVWTFERKPVR